MCGYQGWFRCPEDGRNQGWGHWSREGARIAPETLTFEMWPDMTECTRTERYPAPGFAYPDGKQAELFSSEHPATVMRHFQWMRQYGIDGAWVQRFLVGLPGGLFPNEYESHMRVVANVRRAARATGRVWSFAYDIAAMPTERVYDTLTADWTRLVDTRVTADPRYVHEKGVPVVLIWGFYYNNRTNWMTPDLGNRLIDFFSAPGKYQAYLIGGGDWDWRRNPDRDWQAMVARLKAYVPWNIGNYSIDDKQVRHASDGHWEMDAATCARRGVNWIPTVYPGFSWDNLVQAKPGSSLISRNGGRFYWEQWHKLALMGVKSVYIAMFDEVDEGTAIFKVTSAPPPQAHFVGFEGLPSDWYLRLTREGIGMLRGKRLPTAELPIQP